jgi:hypothetical protein
MDVRCSTPGNGTTTNMLIILSWTVDLSRLSLDTSSVLSYKNRTVRRLAALPLRMNLRTTSLFARSFARVCNLIQESNVVRATST